jgi:hypothetical protein
MKNETGQLEFENWYSDAGVCQNAIEKNARGSYQYIGCANAWKAWQAAFEVATNLEMERCAKLCEEFGEEWMCDSKELAKLMRKGSQ